MKNEKKIYLHSAFLITALIVFANFSMAQKTNSEKGAKKNFHDFTVKTIDGEDFDLSKLKGKKILVVNTASKCGLTPQYAVLQELYETIDTSKFEIIGFPANNFLQQEPGSSDEIKTFCQLNYGVTFPMMEKVSVCDFVYQSYPPDTVKATKTTTDEIYK
jgi:glutathione peroxidase